MNCPVCRDPMIVLELEQVEIDHCPSCKGIWLDSGELELLLEDVHEKDRLFSSFEADRNSSEKPRRCPICSKKMEKVLGGVDRRVKLDRCRRRDGLWFDLGELEVIFKAGTFGTNPKVLDLLKNMFAKAVP